MLLNDEIHPGFVFYVDISIDIILFRLSVCYMVHCVYIVKASDHSKCLVLIIKAQVQNLDGMCTLH